MTEYPILSIRMWIEHGSLGVSFRDIAGKHTVLDNCRAPNFEMRLMNNLISGMIIHKTAIVIFYDHPRPCLYDNGGDYVTLRVPPTMRETITDQVCYISSDRKLVDCENNPYGDSCYGFFVARSRDDMVLAELFAS